MTYKAPSERGETTPFISSTDCEDGADGNHLTTEFLEDGTALFHSTLTLWLIVLTLFVLRKRATSRLSSYLIDLISSPRVAGSWRRSLPSNCVNLLVLGIEPVG